MAHPIYNQRGNNTLTKSLDLLTRLNEARRIHQWDAARELEERLDEHDLRCGYDRLKSQERRAKYRACNNARNGPT